MQWTVLKVQGPKNTVSKLMDLDETPIKINGPPVHFTLNKISMTFKVVVVAQNKKKRLHWLNFPFISLVNNDYFIISTNFN